MGVALPAITPATTAMATSLDKFTGKLDQGVELAVALHSLNPGAGSTNPAYQLEAASYYVMTPASGTTAAVYAAKDTVIAPITSSGTVVTVGTIRASSRFAGLSGARFSYLAPSGDVTTNPGFTTPLTTTVTSYPLTGFGRADGTTGWEIEMDRTALGLPTGNPNLNLFAIQNNGGGDYASSDFIPNAVVGGTNLGAAGPNPDFTNNTAFPGTQSATLALVTVTTATKASDAAALAMSVFPNPSAGVSTVSYRVAESSANVNIALTDLLGRSVRVIETGVKKAGTQTAVLNTTSLAAGTYLLRVQVGGQVSTSKVSVL